MFSLSTYVNGRYKKKADKGVSEIHEHKTLHWDYHPSSSRCPHKNALHIFVAVSMYWLK